ncbi:Uncharacterised protein [Chlamydia trachomatis]|nr:Uncharacterised protein [Chlamydia trachomatis]
MKIWSYTRWWSVLSGIWTAQKGLNHRVNVRRPCLCEAAIWSSERVPMIQSMNTRNRAAWIASVFDLVVDAPQSGFLHRQRGVPLAVLLLRFIGPWQTGQFGLGVLIQ